MRIAKYIPNTITCLNLVSGILSIIFSFQGNFRSAALFIFAAAVCDFLDGMTARALKAYSELGKQLDSLSDLVSFGLAPSFILYNIMAPVHGDFSEEWTWGIAALLCLMLAVFSALRLGKFNIDERQETDFYGLPTPAAAIFIASGIHYFSGYPEIMTYISENLFLLPLLSVILSILLVSEIKMFSFKFKSINFYKNKPRYIFLLAVILIAAVVIPITESVTAAIFVIIVAYIAANIVMAIGRLISRTAPEKQRK